MALTPNDIQTQEFKTKLVNGLDPDEVKSFLIYVAEQFELLQREKDRFEEEVVRLRDTVNDLMSREELLKRTIMTTQKWSDELKQKSQRESEIIIKDAELQADEIVKNAMVRKQMMENDIIDLKEKQIQALSELERVIEDLQRVKDRIKNKKEENIKTLVVGK
jgi:cell division initiation protein